MLILASNSPRRKELLTLDGYRFSVMPASIDESTLPGEQPGDYVLRLAQGKAQVVARQVPAEAQAEAVVIAADTTVVDGGAILGKPADAAEAESMLRQLRGHVHQVYTGLAVLRLVDGEQRQDICITDVPMRTYTDAEMAAYIASGDPFDKAGGYAIQHAGFNPVEALHGCYPNVMGLPVCRLAKLLAQLGIPPSNEITRECRLGSNEPCLVFRSATK